MNIYKLNSKQLTDCLITTIKANLVPFIQGSPGIGKSDIVKTIVKQFNLELIDLRLSMCDITDLNGLPKFEDGKASFQPFDIFPLQDTPLPKGKNGWLLFLDEFNSASRSVMAASYKLILDRMVGNHKLHDRCVIVCAGNNDTDNAITTTMSTALQSRLVHLELEPTIKDWSTYAFKHNIRSEIIAYLSMNPNHLNVFDPDTQESRGEKTFACPRTWSFTDRLLKAYLGNRSESTLTEEDYAILYPLLSGTITSSIASAFLAFCKVSASLPSIKDIVKGNSNVPIPDDESSKWFILTYLIKAAIVDYKDNPIAIKNICSYVERFDNTFIIMFVSQISNIAPTLKSNDGLLQLITKVGEFIGDL